MVALSALVSRLYAELQRLGYKDALSSGRRGRVEIAVMPMCNEFNYLRKLLGDRRGQPPIFSVVAALVLATGPASARVTARPTTARTTARTDATRYFTDSLRIGAPLKRTRNS
jgi:hypothetical protein